MTDNFEQAPDTIVYFPGNLIDEGDLVDSSLLINHRAGKGGHLLVWRPAIFVKHSGRGESMRINLTHGTFGVVEDDVVF